ncbi:MAG: hypothetical protein RH859_00625 [Longimicrobiales bacterium]
MNRADEETARRVREVADRAVRRLDILEWVILLGAVVVALGGGALVALMVAEPLGWSVRGTWIVASLLLFGVPGAVVLRRTRREEEEIRRRLERSGPADPRAEGNDGNHG